LHFTRYSSRTQPGHGVQSPTLAIVAQGGKQIMLGDEAFTYDPGHYLVVSLDLPVSDWNGFRLYRLHNSVCC
jgi:hypothetical protein